MGLFLLHPSRPGRVLARMLATAKAGADFCHGMAYAEAGKLPQDAVVIFALAPDFLGQDSEFNLWLAKNYPHPGQEMAGIKAGMLVAVDEEEFSKAAATQAIWLLNSRGCAFIGHPLVEYIRDYKNFAAWEKATGKKGPEICDEQCSGLARRLHNWEPLPRRQKVVALYASQRHLSNTFDLWHMVKRQLVGKEISEVHINNGIMQDCRGCSFSGCLHYAQQQGCFYGGMVVSEVYPAVEQADEIVFVCPNYNDAISANMMAVINRLTALYRTTSFHEKKLWGIIVSGNSGGDLVARQLLGALCLNKGFYLPGNFALLATANNPGTIGEIPGIERRVTEFAGGINASEK